MAEVGCAVGSSGETEAASETRGKRCFFMFGNAVANVFFLNAVSFETSGFCFFGSGRVSGIHDDWGGMNLRKGLLQDLKRWLPGYVEGLSGKLCSTAALLQAFGGQALL